MFFEWKLGEGVFIEPVFAFRGRGENVEKTPLEYFAVKMFVSLNCVDGIGVVDVSKAFGCIGFVIDGEVNLGVISNNKEEYSWSQNL